MSIYYRFEELSFVGGLKGYARTVNISQSEALSKLTHQKWQIDQQPVCYKICEAIAEVRKNKSLFEIQEEHSSTVEVITCYVKQLTENTRKKERIRETSAPFELELGKTLSHTI